MKLTDSEVKCLERAERIYTKMQKEYKNRTAINSPDTITSILKARLSHLEHEEFHVVFMTNQHEIIEIECMSRGTINRASVYPREIAKRALELNAAAIMLAHNHPSGLSSPSSADISITNKVRECMNLLDIRVLDHIIIALGASYSFANNGLMN